METVFDNKLFSSYKEQMFNKTSTEKSPWVIINSDNKMIGRLNAMRYVLKTLEYDGKKKLKPKKWSKAKKNLQISLKNIEFKNLTPEQYNLLYKLKSNE